MISLKKQVVSLELAKRLRSLGVKQESLFYWMDREELNGRKGEPPLLLYEKREGDPGCYSAFTVAELGHLLPPGN